MWAGLLTGYGWPEKMNTVKHFERALGWIDANTVANAGVVVSSKSDKPYPEVSGYFIPTLLAWNEGDRAFAYGRWLLTKQHAAGCWGDPNLDEPYAFDTGQVIKGLLSLYEKTSEPEWESALRRACNWIVSLIDDTGRPHVPDEKAWGNQVPLGVLLYSFEAVRRAGVVLNEPAWIKCIDRSVAWFISQPELIEFTHLSHFHAYILEALCDLGFHNLARKGMEKIADLQRADGAIPAYHNVRWVCSTGLFQYAIVWYKLGEIEKGESAFTYASKLQNKSGGWYGSYGLFSKYFRKAEISWSVKYYLDALSLRLRYSFEKMSPIFSETIDYADGRYQLIREQIKKASPSVALDAGCGKGRYLKNLAKDFPSLILHGADLSTRVMESISSNVLLKQGSLMGLPYSDASFDLVYTIEALEHAVHIQGALRELLRVIKPGGTLIVIDKNKCALGSLKLPDWEQWFDTADLRYQLEKIGLEVKTIESVPYEGRTDKLFTAWIATKPPRIN